VPLAADLNGDPADPEVDESLGHLRAIHAMTSATVAANSVESIYEAALNVLVDSVSADRAAVLLYDSDDVMRFKAWRGLSEGYRRAADGHSPWSRDDPAPEIIEMPDVAGQEGLGGLRDVILAEGIRSLVFVPLLYGNRLLGKFMLYADRARSFRPAELALARTVAAHIAFALEKRRLEDELRLSADKLGATLNAMSEGLVVLAPEGGLLLANQAAAAMMGFSSPGALLEADFVEIGTRFQLRDEHGEPLPLAQLPGRAALRGEEPEEMLVRSRTPGTGEERFALIRANPVRDDEGRVRFAVSVFRDVTDRQRALEALRTSEARLAFLASASRRLLTTSLDPRRVLEEVVDLVVPELADWCSVRELTEDGALERVAVAPQPARRDALLNRLDGYGDLLRGQPEFQDLASGRSVLVPEITPAILERVASDAEHVSLLGDLGLRSAMLVPLRARGRTVGVLSLAAGPNRPAYTAADLALAEELAGRVAAMVDNARLYAMEHATAETLARALLPGRLPEVPGLEIAARYRAAGQVGGDFYDCFPLRDGTWLFVVGDVCGRGIHAASMTSLTRHSIRAAALHASSPAEVLHDLNRLLLEAATQELAAWLSRDQGSEPGFCTVCLAEVTPTQDGAHVLLSTAGHPLPMLVRASGEVSEVGRPGSLLGVMSGIDLSEERCHVGPGDALVLFTDGITERRRHREHFEEHLPATLRASAGAPAVQLARAIEDAAVSFTPDAPQDDMAVLTITVPRPAKTAANGGRPVAEAGVRPE
jgi:PAS domain S-box-containing protein